MRFNAEISPVYQGIAFGSIPFADYIKLRSGDAAKIKINDTAGCHEIDPQRTEQKYKAGKLKERIKERDL
jgi:hypothetical protein